MKVPRHISIPRNRAVWWAAGAVAASALAIVYKARQAEHANPPQGKFINIGDVKLHYRETGAGQPLVLLHGNGTMIQDYEISGLVDQASTNYRVITFDRPGFGCTNRPRTTVWTAHAQAKLLSEAFDRLSLVRPVVVGHSWGTQVALALALDHPEKVKSLVLLSGYYFPGFRLDVFLLSPPALPVIGDLLRYTISPWVGRLIWPLILKKLFGPSPVPKRFRAFPTWMALRPSLLRAGAAESALMVPGAAALRRRYNELKLPVYIIAGEDDRIVNPHRQSARLHDSIPQSEFRLMAGVGHMVHHTACDQVMDLIEQAAGSSSSPTRTSALSTLDEAA